MLAHPLTFFFVLRYDAERSKFFPEENLTLVSHRKLVEIGVAVNKNEGVKLQYYINKHFNSLILHSQEANHSASSEVA